jgi:4-amino-4-deoxy-L-arabinose transferase-like glycosyltransferase
MSVARRPPSDRAQPGLALFAQRLVFAGQRLVAENREGVIVAGALGCFAALWMLYDTFTLAPVDLRWDASEASLWAQNFALGYKHPPMTGWLFALWFAVFPRADWAAHLLYLTMAVATLAVAWRLLRDHLDRERALFGLAALFVVPLYTVKTAELNANTVMMPFWAAALLFYLRARHGLGVTDAFLAGAFASLAVLGKYWAVFLLAGMAVASVIGVGTRRFWRSPAPYVMAAGAAIVIAPHAIWFVTEPGGASYAFVRTNVMAAESFGAALAGSAYYLLGIAAYAIGPLLFLAALRPTRSALADIIWPGDDDRQQAILLFAVPLVLPALVNLVLPYRLTPDWTFPNWPLLPIVLYASLALVISTTAVAAAGLIALAMSLAALIASPFIAYQKLRAGADPNRPSSHHVVEVAERLAAQPPLLFWGSPELTEGLPFYLPNARPLEESPLSPAGRADIGASGLLIACLKDDAPCQATAAALAIGTNRSADVTYARSFLGLAGPPSFYRVTVLPPRPRQ